MDQAGYRRTHRKQSLIPNLPNAGPSFALAWYAAIQSGPPFTTPSRTLRDLHSWPVRYPKPALVSFIRTQPSISFYNRLQGANRHQKARWRSTLQAVCHR
ncbi:hypothetical protein VD0001_g1067 [Verticillium dahliae]|nr:hypothetical protein VD0003_g2890 [Verticillium dahliae]PNH76497.1 hypothetical protein VD0001_g1067 [Verticillium dahliae]